MPTVYYREGKSAHKMEKIEKNPKTMTRTEYVISNLTGVRSPMEFSVAEKMALRRLGELDKIVKGISSKWFKNKSDLQMIDQTKAEMNRISLVLKEKRVKFGTLG